MNRRFFIAALGASVCGIAAGCGKSLANPDAFLTVEDSLCLGCGQCVRVCKGTAITVINNKATIDPSKCVHCGNCVKVCPYDAIS
jgi:uncharacterized protein